MTGKKNTETTLCWSCSKSTTGGCSWAKNFEPVEGWKAIPHMRDGIVSYKVKTCPEFSTDARDETLDPEGVKKLGAAVIANAAKDYNNICKTLGNRLKIISTICESDEYLETLFNSKRYQEKFFNSQYAKIFSEYDPAILKERIENKHNAGKELTIYVEGARDLHHFMKENYTKVTECANCENYCVGELMKTYGWCKLKNRNVYPYEYCERGFEK